MLKRQFPFYLGTAGILLFIRLFYRDGSAQALKWLLAPTGQVVKLISRLPFYWEPGVGYVNHDLHFIIAPSCSGLTFLTIVSAMLIFSFLHRIPDRDTDKGLWSMEIKSGLWVVLSMVTAYACTILANSVRILLAIFLPIWGERYGLLPEGLTGETLHTMIGTATYFGSLLLLYGMGNFGFVSLFYGDRKRKLQKKEHPGNKKGSGILACRLIPLFWYLSAVLGIPFVLSVLHRDLGSFMSYGFPVLLVCAGVCILSLSRTALNQVRQKKS